MSRIRPYGRAPSFTAVIVVGLLLAAMPGEGVRAQSPDAGLSTHVLPADVKTSCYRKLICFHTRQSRTGVDAWVEALTAGPITFTMRPTFENLKGPTRTDPVILNSPGVMHLASLRERGPDEWSYYFKYTYHPGLPDKAVPDPDAVYELPYAPGKIYTITQGNHSSYTHKRREAFAVDWGMREGTPVHAARAGRVVGAGGWSNSRKRGRGNFIWIEHDDGTVAWYLHLRKGGVLVKTGQRVRAGDHIGYSGNTGKTNGPHLHFQVSMATSGRYAFVTVPVKFRTTQGVVARIRTRDAFRRPRN